MTKTALESQQKKVFGYAVPCVKGGVIVVKMHLYCARAIVLGVLMREVPTVCAQIAEAIQDGAEIFRAPDGRKFEMSAELMADLSRDLQARKDFYDENIAEHDDCSGTECAEGADAKVCATAKTSAGCSAPKGARTARENLDPVGCSSSGARAVRKSARRAAPSKISITHLPAKKGERDTPPKPRGKGGRGNVIGPNAARGNASASKFPRGWSKCSVENPLKKIKTVRGRTSVVSASRVVKIFNPKKRK